MVIEFRPDTLIQKYHELLDESLQSFCDPKTGEFKPEHSEVIDHCPACGGNDLYPYVQRGPLSYKTCANCKSLFQSPAIRKESLEQWYSNSEASQMGELIRRETYDSRKSKKFMPIYERYRKHLSSGRLLDVGCSWGYFMELVNEKSGMDVEGIELNFETARWVRENKGYTVYTRDLRSLESLSERYDTITCWGTLTHVHQPVSFLSSCFDALKPGGVLLISTPNCRGFEFVLGEHYEGFQVTVLNFFSIQGLRAALGRSGFQDIEIRCIGKKDVDIVRSMLKRTPQAIEVLSGFMKDLLLDDSKEAEKKRIAFQRFLTEHEFSALMEAVAVKPMN